MRFSLGDARVETRGTVFVAHNACVIGDVVLGHLSSVWFNVVIRGDNDAIVIGERSNIQDASVLHTDPGYRLEIGRNVSVGHKAMLHGCRIGDGSLIGINSVILNGARIGRHCLVGANSLIAENKEIPDRSLAVGSPARVLRSLSDKEVDSLMQAAQTYVNRIELYRNNFEEMAHE